MPRSIRSLSPLVWRLRGSVREEDSALGMCGSEMQRIVARLAAAGILCCALAACTDVGDSLAPGTGTGDDATSGQTGGATHDAAPDSNDARAETGTDGTVATPFDASVAGDAVADTGMMSAVDTGSGNDSGSTQGADTGVAGSSDTGTPDTGPPDTGQPDTGIVADTGAPDTGGADAGLDAGAGDTGSDSSGTDTGGTDTGANDSGTADADATLGDGASDGSVVDTGSSPDTGSAGEGGSTDPCDPNNPNATTITCLNSVTGAGGAGGACLACAQANGCLDSLQGWANCESGALPTTNAILFPSPLPDGKTCSQVVAPASVPVTERAICLEVMRTVFASNCGASTQLDPCLCGSTDPSNCNAGTAAPTGAAAFDLYACDINSTSSLTIYTNFTKPTFGAGAANSVLSCAGQFGCHCLGD